MSGFFLNLPHCFVNKWQICHMQNEKKNNFNYEQQSSFTIKYFTFFLKQKIQKQKPTVVQLQLCYNCCFLDAYLKKKLNCQSCGLHPAEVLLMTVVHCVQSQDHPQYVSLTMTCFDSLFQSEISKHFQILHVRFVQKLIFQEKFRHATPSLNVSVSIHHHHTNPEVDTISVWPPQRGISWAQSLNWPVAWSDLFSW